MLQEKADGMFLWVRLVADHLMQQASPQEFSGALEQLPEGLDQAYGTILTCFKALPDKTTRDRVLLILFWLCAAKRTLKIDEIADGVALNRHGVLDGDTRIKKTDRYIFDPCTPLVERTTGGYLRLVHFSAKEYPCHKQSGLYISNLKAKMALALACIKSLNSALRLLPRFRKGYVQCNNEDMSFVVKGGTGLHDYARVFWLDHTMAYLQNTALSNEHPSEVIEELTILAKVQKHPQGQCMSGTQLGRGVQSDLTMLREIPACYNLCMDWLYFQSSLDREILELKTVQEQLDWRLKEDETYLSLLGDRVRNVTESLLSMDELELPNHIELDDLRDFKFKHGWLCRYSHCSLISISHKQRDVHETSHVPSYPCEKCDFSGRGFRSRKTLETHIQRYHTMIEDLRIPDSLDFMEGSITIARSRLKHGFDNHAERLGCWNDRGRKELMKGFHKIIKRVESEISLAEPPGLGDPSHAASDSSAGSSASLSLSKICNKVESIDTYDSLLDFQKDLAKIPNLMDDSSASDRTE